MIEFKRYFAALLRGEHAEPRFDEALRDYQTIAARIQAGLY